MELLMIGILLLVGVVFFIVEIAFIPGVGLSGVMGTLFMGGAIAYAFYMLGIFAGLITIASVVVLCASLLLWAIYGKSIDHLALKKNIDSTVASPQRTLIKDGDKGVSTTRLALIGNANINGYIIEVTSSDGLINEKTEIIVDRIADNVIFVRKT